MRIIIKREEFLLKRNTHPVLRWSRNIFLFIGVLLLGYCAFVLLDTTLYESFQTRGFEQEMKDRRPTVANGACFQDLSFHLTTTGALGQIEITRLGVAAMILEGTNDKTLRRAVGHISGTALPGQQGNVGIAGHRDSFFRALRNVRQDDEITLTTLDATYRYRVDSTKIVGPEDTQVLDNSSEDMLTLVTCYPFYFVGPSPERFIVRARRTTP